jgi:hypothetical protein
MATYTTRHASGLEFELHNRRYAGDYKITYRNAAGTILYEEASEGGRVTRIGDQRWVDRIGYD